jgi:hypothetical protein
VKTIWKYELEIKDRQLIYLPLRAQILSVTEQYDKPVLYALVDDEETYEKVHHVIMHGTGHAAEDVDDAIFLGTLKFQAGQFMLHVFIEK